MKKVILAVAALVLTASAVVFTACEKNVDVQSSSKTIPLTSKTNASTPLDFIGITHNQIMDQVGEMMRNDFEYYASLPNPSEDDEENLLNKIKFSLGEVIVPDSISINFGKDIASALLMFDSVDINNFLVSESFKRIEEYCNDALDNGCPEDLYEIANYGIKSAWSESDTLSTIFFTVMKYSANYWTVASVDPSNPWYCIIKTYEKNDSTNNLTKGISIKEKFNKIKNWFADKVLKKHEPSKAEIVILCDATGALIGGLGLGGWLGAITLGGICSACAAA